MKIYYWICSSQLMFIPFISICGIVLLVGLAYKKNNIFYWVSNCLISFALINGGVMSFIFIYDDYKLSSISMIGIGWLCALPFIIYIFISIKFRDIKKESINEIGMSTISKGQLIFCSVIGCVTSLFIHILIRLSYNSIVNLYTIGTISKVNTSLYATIDHSLISIFVSFVLFLLTLFIIFYINATIRFFYANYVYLSITYASMNIIKKFFKSLFYCVIKLNGYVTEHALFSMLHSINILYFINPNKKENFIMILRNDFDQRPNHQYNYQFIRTCLLSLFAINLLFYSIYLYKKMSFIILLLFIFYVLIMCIYANTFLHCLTIHDDIVSNEKGYNNMIIINNITKTDQKVEMQNSN